MITFTDAKLLVARGTAAALLLTACGSGAGESEVMLPFRRPR
jgi:hypothetical protein